MEMSALAPPAVPGRSLPNDDADDGGSNEDRWARMVVWSNVGRDPKAVMLAPESRPNGASTVAPQPSIELPSPAPEPWTASEGYPKGACAPFLDEWIVCWVAGESSGKDEVGRG